MILWEVVMADSGCNHHHRDDATVFWFWGPQGKIIHLSLECERVGTHSHLKMIPLKKNTHLPTTWHFH